MCSVKEYYYEIVRKNIKDVFERIYFSYDRTRGKIWSELMDYIVRIKPDRYIIDLGAGTGRYSLVLARSHRVLAVDVAYNMCKVTLRKAKRRKLDANLDVVVADILSLPLRDNIAKGILLIAVLHHIPYNIFRRKVLEDVVRVGVKGGIVVITVWSRYQPRHIVRVISTYLTGRALEIGDAYVKWRHMGRTLKRYYHLFSKGELRRLVSSINGLTIERIYTMKLRSKYFPQNYVCVAVVNKC